MTAPTDTATFCACHDDGPPDEHGRCETCLLPRPAPSPRPEGNAPTPEEIAAPTAIDAARSYRNRTGCTLVEAKEITGRARMRAALARAREAAEANDGMRKALRQREQEHLAACAEADELRAWQEAVADGLGFLNRAEGQRGYEVAEPSVIIRAFRDASAFPSAPGRCACPFDSAAGIFVPFRSCPVHGSQVTP
jgi:hypothetical protein